MCSKWRLLYNTVDSCIHTSDSCLQLCVCLLVSEVKAYVCHDVAQCGLQGHGNSAKDQSLPHYDVAWLSSLVIRTLSGFADTLRTTPAFLLVYKKRPSGSAQNVIPPLNLTAEMFKPWSFHHHYQQAHHQNPYVHMRSRWHGRGPSRLIWFAIGAGSACVWIAHKEAHEGRKSQYWNHCFKAPIQVPPMLPSSPNQTTTPTGHEHTNERWQHWNRMSEQQWREEREHVLHMKKQAQDTVSSSLVRLLIR
jgi:hypothetical protein